MYVVRGAVSGPRGVVASLASLSRNWSLIHVSEPVDVGLAIDAPGGVTPLVVEVVLVPFVDTFKVFRQRVTADWYLWIWSVEQVPETVEKVIHQLPHPRWPGLTSPEVVVLHPYCLTSALIKRRSIFVITPSGHGQPVAAQRVSVVDTVTPPIYGVFLECMGLLRHRELHP